MDKFKVVKVFRDKYNEERIYRIGEIFGSEDKERIKDLKDRGLIADIPQPSFDALTKNEIIEKLKEKEIEFDSKQKKADLLKLLKE